MCVVLVLKALYEHFVSFQLREGLLGSLAKLGVYMPCSRTPVDLFTGFDFALLLGVAFVA